MLIQGKRVTVTNAATRLDTWPDTLRDMLITNRGAASVDIGGAAVTTGTGYELSAGATLSLDRAATGGGVYAITASGTVRCDVLEGSGSY